MVSSNYHIYIDESLAFPSGTGAEELVGISIQPEVETVYRDDRCMIKGKVVLQGEFVPTDQADLEREGRPELSFVEGSHFEHHIPLEIEIPIEKVENREEVNVDIHSFDYELPEPGTITFHSELTVIGVQQSARSIPEQKEEEKWDTPYTYERELLPPDEPAEEDVPWEETTILESEPEEEIITKQEETVEVEITTGSREMEREEDSMEEEVVGESAEEEYEEEERGDIFTRLFQKREESSAKMRVYIVQGEDTLESIAEHYELSVKEIRRWNGDKESLEAGDLLYLYDELKST